MRILFIILGYWNPELKYWVKLPIALRIILRLLYGVVLDGSILWGLITLYDLNKTDSMGYVSIVQGILIISLVFAIGFVTMHLVSLLLWLDAEYDIVEEVGHRYKLSKKEKRDIENIEELLE